MTKNKKSIIIGIIVVVIAIIIGAFALLGAKTSNNDKQETKATTEQSTPKEKEKEVKKEEFTKEGAVNAATEILKLMQVAPVSGQSMEDRIKELSNEKPDFDKVFKKEAWDKVKLTDFMETDPRGKILTGQSMLSVLYSIEEVGNKEMKPADVDLSGVVYFDEEVKVAYVPVDLYTNVPTNLSFELVYIDGEWLFQPYTLIAQLAIKTMEQSALAQTPEGKNSVELPEESKDSESKTKESSDKKDADKKDSDKKDSTKESNKKESTKDSSK